MGKLRRLAEAPVPSMAKPIQRQSSKALLRLARRTTPSKRLAGRLGIQAFSEIAQGVVGERSRNGKISACRSAHQGFEGMKAVLASGVEGPGSLVEAMRDSNRGHAINWGVLIAV
jgi:hypothetical protein